MDWKNDKSILKDVLRVYGISSLNLDNMSNEDLVSKIKSILLFHPKYKERTDEDIFYEFDFGRLVNADLINLDEASWNEKYGK